VVKGFLRFLLTLLLYLSFGLLAVAQTGKIAVSQHGGTQLVGLWQASVSFQPGMTPILVRDSFTAEGKWREEVFTDNVVSGWWEGTYSLAADATLTTNETAVSPQVCMAGTCKANNPPTVTVSKVRFEGADTFIQDIVNPANGQVVFTIKHTRVQSPATTGTTPQIPKVNNDRQNPLAAGQNPQSWNGAYTDGRLKLVLQEQNNMVIGLIELAANQYQLQAQGDANKLQGVFKTEDGQQFELRISRVNGGLVLSTGGKNYNLQMVQLTTPGANPAAPAPKNPLGN